MPVYFLSANQSSERILRIEARIREVIPDVIRITNLEDIARDRAAHPDDPVNVLVVTPPEDNAFFERVVDVALNYRDHAFFILISEDISATDYKRLVRTGGADWVSATGAPHEILEIIGKRRLPHRDLVPVAKPKGEPVVIAFVPSSGGVGNATLVTEIGVWLKTNKASKERRVCVIDLDFQTSHICDHIDLEPRLQIQEICANPERLDTHLFDLFTSHHKSGLDLIAAPRTRFDLAGLKVAALDALFDLIARRYELVLIDLPVTWFSWSSDIIANSDAVLVTGVNTIPGLRQIAETMASIRALQTAGGQLAAIINRCEQRMIGGIVRRQHVESVLVNEKVFYVRDDLAARVESINTGTPMAESSPSSSLMKEIGVIASYCAELKSARKTAV